MVEDKIKLEELANNQEIRDTAMNAVVEAFPDEFSSLVLDDNFNKQLQEAPMAVLVYASAVKAYAQINEKKEPLKSFPDLLSSINDDSERAMFFRAQIKSADQEYRMEKDAGGGAGIERLLKNVNDGYLNNPTSTHISLIASYGLEWNKKQEKNYEYYKRTGSVNDEPTSPQISLEDRLTTMASENYGEFICNNWDYYNELIVKPALIIAMAEYTQAFKHQKSEQEIPSVEDMKKHPGIQNLAEQISVASNSAKAYDELPAFLDDVRENPQNFFKNEDFINTTDFDNQQNPPSQPPHLPDSKTRGD